LMISMGILPVAPSIALFTAMVVRWTSLCS
jgi:hypothetical protein